MFLAVAYDRPTDPQTVRPLPAGYSLSHLTIKRADHVTAGDLVVGDVDAPVSRPYRIMRYATYVAAPYDARPVPVDAHCERCRLWRRNASTDGWVCLRPHFQVRADELIAVITPASPVHIPDQHCVYTCSIGVSGPYSPGCPDCHGRPCSPCLTAGANTH
nr:hypothetical protein [Streptomyces sp. SID5468]